MKNNKPYTKYFAALSALSLIATSANAAIIIDGVDFGTSLTIGNSDIEGVANDLIETGVASIATGDTLTLQAGSDTVIGQQAASSLTINGGSFIVLNSLNNINIGNGTGGDGVVTILGGSASFESDVTRIGRDGATGLLTIGGGTVDILGTLEIGVIDGATGSIDFTSGSTGSLSVAGLDIDDFQTFAADGELTFNGATVSETDFATTFQVSGNTISLAGSTIPEPSSSLLGGIGLLALAARRRR